MYWGASLWIALNAKISNLNSILKLYKIINLEEVSGEGLDGPEHSAIVYSGKLSFGL